MALSEQHDCLFYGLGVHPWYAGEQREGVMERLRTLVMSQPAGLVAIGECGLDLRSHVPQEGQLALFEAQVRLAADAGLPLMIHSVRANDTVTKLLRRFKPPRGGVIHAFSGSLQQAEAFWQLGFRLGVGGVISFERANKTREVFGPCRSRLWCWKPIRPICPYKVSKAPEYPGSAAENSGNIDDIAG